MSIHFKFKSAKDFDSISFPGTVIRVIDLKKAIVDKKKLSKGLDFDLVITDAHSGKVYEDENTQLPRNTSVTVKRVPCQPNHGLLARMKAEAAAAAAANTPMLVPPTATPSSSSITSSSTIAQSLGSITTAEVSEESQGGAQTMEDELAALQSIHEQAEDMRGVRLGNKTWTASGGSNADKVMNYYSGSGPGGGRGGFGAGRGGGSAIGGGRGTPGEFGAGMMGRGGGNGGMGPQHAMVGKPPPNYVCYRCGTPGHFIQNCPTNGDPEYDQHRVKKKTGIPKSFMKPVTDPSEIPVGAGKTVVNAPWGGLAIIEPQNKNFSKLIAKSGGSATLDQLIMNPDDHLACPLCKRLMNDAVLIPCCQESACDECVRSALIDHNLVCPLCSTPNMSPERLLPNKKLRKSVDEFLRRARTEQQERAQLVKEAEEKALAKQKAAEMAANASRRAGQSADAMLDIKKNARKDTEEEDDEFGGDIFGQDQPDDSDQNAKESEKETKVNSSAPPTPIKNVAQPPTPAHSPPLAPQNSQPPLPPEPHPSDKSEKPEENVAQPLSSANDMPQESRKGSDASMQSNDATGQQGNGSATVSQGSIPGSKPFSGPHGHNGPPGWGMGHPRGPPMGFPPHEPWFDGPPRPPGPWFDRGPPPPWFDGPFPGRGPVPNGPRTMNGGRGRGMPPGGYYGPPTDYFGPPPGHPDYFGPPMPWFDGPMPPFGPPGGPGWYDGPERGYPPRDEHDHQDAVREPGAGEGKRRDGEKPESKPGTRSTSASRDARQPLRREAKRRRSRSRSRSRNRNRSRSRSRSRSRGTKSRKGDRKSKSRSRSLSRLRGRSSEKSASRSRRSRSGNRTNKPGDDEVEKRTPKETSGADSDRQREPSSQSFVKDVELDKIAAPAIDLDFLAGDDHHSESDNDMKPGNDSTQEDGKHSRNSNESTRERSKSATRNSKMSSDRRGSNSSTNRSRRSRSRSPSRRGRSSDSRRKRQVSSNSRRSSEREPSTPRSRDRARDRGRDREKDHERDRDRNRDRGRDRRRERDRSRDKLRGRSREKDRDRDQDRDRSRRSRDQDQERSRKRVREDSEAESDKRPKLAEKTAQDPTANPHNSKSKADKKSSSGLRGGGVSSRNGEKRRVQVEGESNDKRKGGRKNSDENRSTRSDIASKKRSILDRLGPATK